MRSNWYKKLFLTLACLSVVGLLNAGMQSEQLVSKNRVNVTVRHCQKYAHDGIVDVAACSSDASTVFYVQEDHNLRTTAGNNWQADLMGSAAGVPAQYIGLADDSSNAYAGTVAVGDTTLASSGTGSTEISANNLGRAQGTYAHTAGTASYTITKVFTASGTQASNKTGLFTLVSSGTMAFEYLYTRVTVNLNDTLTVTWTVSI